MVYKALDLATIWGSLEPSLASSLYSQHVQVPLPLNKVCVCVCSVGGGGG